MVKEEKIRLAEEIAEKLSKAKVVMIADIGRIPSKLFQKIRKELRGDAEIKVIKKRILLKAIEKAGKEELKKLVEGRPALIFTEKDVFEVYRKISQLREPLPVKPGMVAPEDIVVPAGPTGLPPGPAIGDFQAAGVPAKIDKGQIAVIKDTVVAKAGEVIKPQVALLLNKLEISPFEAGLEVIGAYADGLIFTKDVLGIKPEDIKAEITRLHEDAYKLAYAIDWPVKEILELKIAEAARNAKALALSIDYIAPETIKELLAKAHAHALKLQEVV